MKCQIRHCENHARWTIEFDNGSPDVVVCTKHRSQMQQAVAEAEAKTIIDQMMASKPPSSGIEVKSIIDRMMKSEPPS